MEVSDLVNRFTHHPSENGQPEHYKKIRDTALQMAMVINIECPDSREKSLAITNLEQTVFWANAAIARNKEED